MPKGSNDLQGLGVLVTRPAHQANNLCQLIEAAGGRPYSLPTISIEPSNQAAQHQARGLLGHLLENDRLIFISANAVEYSRVLLGPVGNWPNPIRTAAIGQATAQAFATTFGLRADLIPQGDNNSEALLLHPELQQVRGQRIIIIRGEGGRPLLGDTLQQRGAVVHYANVYRRGLPDINTEQHRDALRQQVDVITATSVEGLQNLIQLLAESMAPWLWSRPLFVIHPRQVDAARRMGFKIIPAVATETNDAALLSAIIKWRQQQPND